MILIGCLWYYERAKGIFVELIFICLDLRILPQSAVTASVDGFSSEGEDISTAMEPLKIFCKERQMQREISKCSCLVSRTQQKIIDRKLVQAVTLLTFIPVVPGSNLDRALCYSC
jgi:hypothetical protein